MKTLKLTLMIVAIIFFTASGKIYSQTKQFNMHAVCEHAWLVCFEQNNTVSGEWTYHLTYHLDKNGKVEWLHWNILSYDLTNDATGEKYILIDTGHDNLNYGGTWNYWNSIQSNNTPYNVFYDQADGFLNLPSQNPSEGTAVYATLKIKSKSGTLIGSANTVIQLHLNADGDLTGSVDKAYFDCY